MADARGPNLFREAALKRVSTPERLDQLVQITDMKGWLALLAAGVIVVAAVSWAFTGILEITVRGSGLLLGRGGVATLASPKEGLCSDIKLHSGAMLRKGDVVGLIAQPELVIDIKVAREELGRLERKYQETLASEARDLVRLKLAANAQKRDALRKADETVRGDLAQAEENVKAYEFLFKENLVSREILIQKRREIPAVLDKIRQIEVEQKSLDAQDAELLKAEGEKVKEARSQAEAASDKLEQLRGKLALCTRVVSQFEGRVLEVLVREGGHVAAGAAMARLEVSGGGARPEILMYVAAKDGVRVKPGMAVHVSPEYARKEEFGYVLGLVASVGAFPVTTDRMKQVLQNDQLVEAFGGKEASFEVHVDLVEDPGTPSGYRWSSSTGYPEPLPSGSVVKAEIIVEQRRPISLVLPHLKSLLGR